MAYQGDQSNMASMNNDFNFELTAEDLAYQGDSGLYSVPDDTSGLAFDNNFNLSTQRMTAAAQIHTPSEGATLAPGTVQNPFQGAVGKSPQFNNGNSAYDHLTLPMPQFPPQATFVPQPEIPMPQTYVSGQPSISVPHRVEATAYGNRGFPTGRPRVRTPEITPNRPPSTPTVRPWIYHRSTTERQRMTLRRTPIHRITRVKDKDGPDPRDIFDAKEYYGPPVDPPAAWGPKDPRTGQPAFSYTEYGELCLGRQYTTEELWQYIYGLPINEAAADDFVPRTVPETERYVPDKLRQGLTLWLGWVAPQCNNRNPTPGFGLCRSKGCPCPVIR